MVVRLALILFTPSFLVGVFIIQLFLQVVHAFRCAWLECCIEFSSIRRAWRRKSFNIEE